jgi:TfoX N-terminal domain
VAYDEDLAHRVRELLVDELHLSEQAMFGGLAFCLSGNIAVGVSREDLFVRVGREATEQALARPHTRPFGSPGREMRGWVKVAPEGVKAKRELSAWVRRGVQFTHTLPPKS